MCRNDAPENPPTTRYEIVPTTQYDQAMVVESYNYSLKCENNQAQNGRFPPESANGPMVPPGSQFPPTSANKATKDSEYYFPPLNNSVLIEEIKEVFHQSLGGVGLRVYQRNKRNQEPMTTSIPPNNFSTPPDPKASNTLNYP